jgi:predicted extracellular nuclease
VLISEVRIEAPETGASFIELFNPGKEPVDLMEWTLWYESESLPGGSLLYRWQARALIPSHGHYLLGRVEGELGLPVDALFNQDLDASGGDLALRQPDGSNADMLGWGNAPPDMREGSATPPPAPGTSLERDPGGAQGNATDRGDNESDFHLNPSPMPQNTGSSVTPGVEKRLAIELEAPPTVAPGEDFSYLLTVTNLTGQAVHGIRVEVPLPDGLSPRKLPLEMAWNAGVIVWDLGQLAAGESQSAVLPVSTPVSYFTAGVHNYFVRAQDWPGLAFGGPVYTRIEGGAIPIGTARSLQGEQVSVEGMVTWSVESGTGMFYLEDESGGLQIRLPEDLITARPSLGAWARLHGTVGEESGTVYLAPETAEDLEIIDPQEGKAPGEPPQVDITQAMSSLEPFLGKLVRVDGTITGIQEYPDHYELTLSAGGSQMALFVDKGTDVLIERLQAGQAYRVSGILDLRDGVATLFLQQQSDFVETFPPVLRIVASAPATVQPGAVATITFTVYNDTPRTLNGLRITIPAPAGANEIAAILDGGSQQGKEIIWETPQLPGAGASLSVKYQVRASGNNPFILTSGYQASASERPTPVSGPPVYTFIGGDVPVWAIQGPGDKSPYALDQVTTQGIVTGIFPGLGGFWIQTPEADEDPRTSEGLFVDTRGFIISLNEGDRVEVTGQIREPYQQTTLIIGDSEDVEVLSHAEPLPKPVELDPPDSGKDARPYYEALEGMLVQVTGPALAISPSSQSGEYAIVLPGHETARLFPGDENGFKINVDDGSKDIYPDRSTLTYAVRSGDQVSGLLGPLAYLEGGYKIEPIRKPEVVQSQKEMPEIAPAREGEFSLMTWNASDLYDVNDPHPAGLPRPSFVAYDLALDKVANTIAAAGAPTIVGLQEVESLKVLQDLSARQALAAYEYFPALLEGADPKGLNVGFLVRTDQAKILEVTQYPPPEGVTNRPPLLIHVQVESGVGMTDLYILNNDFVSLSGDEILSQAAFDAQESWSLAILNQVTGIDPEVQVAIIGDFDSVGGSPTLEKIRAAGLRDTFEILAPQERYTYVQDGISTAPDHILVTQGLRARLKRVDILHVNADYPPPPPDDRSPERKSDHDPVVATFSIAP